MTTSYFDLLPCEVIELIYEKKHKIEMKDTFSFIEKSNVHSIRPKVIRFLNKLKKIDDMNILVIKTYCLELREDEKMVFEVINDKKMEVMFKPNGVGHFFFQYDPYEGELGWFMEEKQKGTYWEMDDFPETTGELYELCG